MECAVCLEPCSSSAWEAPCSNGCGRVCHLACAQRWSRSVENYFATSGMRMIDCSCGTGVFAPRCPICMLSIQPPAAASPTCAGTCGVLAHDACIAVVEAFGAVRDCGACGKPWGQRSQHGGQAPKAACLAQARPLQPRRLRARHTDSREVTGARKVLKLIDSNKQCSEKEPMKFKAI